MCVPGGLDVWIAGRCSNAAEMWYMKGRRTQLYRQSERLWIGLKSNVCLCVRTGFDGLAACSQC